MERCKLCNKIMISGSVFEKDKRNDYIECPKCHFRIYKTKRDKTKK